MPNDELVLFFPDKEIKPKEFYVIFYDTISLAFLADNTLIETYQN